MNPANTEPSYVPLNMDPKEMLASPPAVAVPPVDDPRIVNKRVVDNGISYERNGWMYVSVRGTPRQRGYAMGFLQAKPFEQVQKMLIYHILEETGHPWTYFVESAGHVFRSKLKEEFNEFYEEMEAIAEGCTAAGTPTTTDEIIAWNNLYTLMDSWFPTQAAKSDSKGGREGGGGGGGGASDRCSGFIANGDYTKDGKIVMAHNSFTQFIDGQYYNVILDIVPDKGHRMIMQSCPCSIWSGTDFFITDKGIVGTETTIGGFYPYENKHPISCRIRNAMQYGNTLDDYVTLLSKQNSGDYANSWLLGDIHTNEIMRLELGLKYIDVQRTKNGYYYGANFAFSPYIRNLECNNTGYCDVRRHQGARQVRLPDMIEENRGLIDLDVAKAIISDHYDVYLNRENPCSRTICSHYDLDGREFMSDPSRPKPYQPRGAVDGSVLDATMAADMGFLMRYGNSCGTPFVAKEFCNLNRQWKHLEPYLNDRPSQPWTAFYTTDAQNQPRLEGSSSSGAAVAAAAAAAVMPSYPEPASLESLVAEEPEPEPTMETESEVPASEPLFTEEVEAAPAAPAAPEPMVEAPVGVVNMQEPQPQAQAPRQEGGKQTRRKRPLYRRGWGSRRR
jgi:hypothetical protein